jgi:hypothetical protein
MRITSIRRFALFVALALIASLSFAKTVASTNHPYQVTLPTGWERVPPATIDALNAEVPPQAAFAYDMGLRPESTHGQGYPYVLIQVFPPARTHLSGLPTDSQFKSIVAEFSRVMGAPADFQGRLDQIKDAGVRNVASSFMKGLSKSSLRVDAAHRRFAAQVGNVNADGKPVTGIAVWMFAPDGSLVQFNCYAYSSDFAKDRGDFGRIVDSFQSTAASDDF